MSKQTKLLSLILIIILFFFGKAFIFNHSTYKGDIAEPIQTNIEDAPEIVYKGTKGVVGLFPQAEYELTGVVKSKKKYVDFSSQISKYDLALAWGDLNKKEIDDTISYSQSGRWYYFRYKADTPVSQDYISKHSANVHIIPKDKKVLKKIKKLKKGHLVTLKGFLVDVDFKVPNASLWTTSRKRDDTGDGACEILYVEKISFK
ncbi:MAG TPA: hypothetical protein GX707_03480 [Epulopiscium sp.]|nr:hypothetical protein [Candidatus Epulonipiscium sp.]